MQVIFGFDYRESLSGCIPALAFRFPYAEDAKGSTAADKQELSI